MVMFGVGLGVPLLVGLALDKPQLALYACIGALQALQTDPRRAIRLRIAGIGISVTAILAAAVLGASLQNHKTAEVVAVLMLSFLAGLPPPVLPYLTLVGKLCAAAVLITAAGLATSPGAAAAFVAGGLFALLLTIAEARWQSDEAPGLSPFDEIRAVWAGNTNPLFYAVTLVAAVALGLVIAETLHANLPGWVGLTVLFVMHPDDAVALRLIVQRIGGTLAGIAVAALLVHFVHAPWPLAVVVIVAAAAFPKAFATNFFWTSGTITLLIMLLLDIALLDKGGDATLLEWRLYDTGLGCLAAGITLLCVHVIHRLRERGRVTAHDRREGEPPENPPGSDSSSAADPGSAP
jgi:hypothetical protein